MIKEIPNGKMGDFHPFPAYADRAAWASLPEEIKKAFLAEAEKLKSRPWPSLPASVYLDFFRNGNRTNYQEIYFGRRQCLFVLTIAECIAGKGEYLDDIISGIWHISEETTWVIPAHLNRIPPPVSNFYHDPVTAEKIAYPEPRRLHDPEDDIYIDLFAAETGSLLSWVYYFLGGIFAEKVPEVTRRMEEEVIRRILIPFLEENNFSWTGLSHDDPVNNWNPWINSNILAAYLVFARVYPRAGEGINKAIKSINRFLHFYSDDGGCDEGPSYFGVAGASLLDFIEELSHVENVSYLYRESRIRNMASYIYKVYIANEYYVNYADAPPRVFVSAGVLERAGKNMDNPVLSDFAGYLRANKWCSGEVFPNSGYSLYRHLAGFFGSRRQEKASIKIPTLVWFPGIQVLTARDKGDSAKGFFFSAKGGHNDESHNHNDVGNFILYYDGKPILVDAGVETYTRDTFSGKRYGLWTMQSCYHNLPSINGFDEAPGKEFRAGEVLLSGKELKGGEHLTTECPASGILFSLDIAGAYPASAGVKSYKRSFVFSPGSHLELTDTYSLGESSSPLILNLLCYDKPEFSGNMAVFGGLVSMDYDSGSFTCEIEEIKLTDPKIHNDWQKDQLYRMRLTRKNRDLTGTLVLRFTPKNK